MMNGVLSQLSDDELVESLRAAVDRANRTEAEIIAHIQEVEARRLYLARAHSSLFSFCVVDLGFSEDAAYNRMEVARAAVRFPAMLEHLRSGNVHLTGLRILAPHLTPENVDTLLARATRKSKRQIEEIVASIAPKPLVPQSIRKLPPLAPPATPPPAPPAPSLAAPTPAPLAEEATPARAETPPERRPRVEPLAEDAFRVQFTATRELKDKLREAQDLLRHEIPNGDLAQIVDKALDLLIAAKKKSRFGVGAKPRGAPKPKPPVDRKAPSRHVPNEVRRAVHQRDGGRCTFVDERGRRCEETGGLELDHIHGFARVPSHDPTGLRLRCRGHNQHAADQMYGRAFMDRARARRHHPDTPPSRGGPP